MSDGIKAMYEDMEEEDYKKSLKNVKKLDSDWLINRINELFNDIRRLDTDKLSLPKHTHNILDDVKENIEKLYSEIHR